MLNIVFFLKWMHHHFGKIFIATNMIRVRMSINEPHLKRGQTFSRLQSLTNIHAGINQKCFIFSGKQKEADKAFAEGSG